ncbi:MAG: glycosyltransferase, partial [Spirochaetia bacterium]|nr:glycosyltransferase [Spirochaetia bacterium]
MRVAVIHDWLTGIRGGERVLEQILLLFPSADIYTLIYNKEKTGELTRGHRVHTSFLQGIPGIFSSYRNFLPLFPAAIESFNFLGYDLVISSSHCVARGAITLAVPHICYCHTPMRYAWDQFHNYFSPERNGRLKYAIISGLMPGLREWDKRTAGRVNCYMANSTTVQKRIKDYYGMESTVVHPPVDTAFFTPNGEKEDFFLMVSALTEYKKVDYAVSLFNRMPDKKLVIVGGGPLYNRIKADAGANITLTGYQDRAVIRDYYRKAKVFIFPGEEDFGITMAESLSCGTPVLALDRGGSLDIVQSGVTGEFYDGTEASFTKNLEKIADKRYDKEKLRSSVLKFS